MGKKRYSAEFKELIEEKLRAGVPWIRSTGCTFGLMVFSVVFAVRT